MKDPVKNMQNEMKVDQCFEVIPTKETNEIKKLMKASVNEELITIPWHDKIVFQIVQMYQACKLAQSHVLYKTNM